MKRIASLLLLALVATLTAGICAAETADAVLKKAAAKISGGEGISANFTLVSGGLKVTGTIKGSGKKFAVESSASSTWYDGKSMWTYNSRSGETTVMTPSAQELAEANPLALVHSYGNLFTAAFAKTQKPGNKVIVLSPKSKKNGYKSVHVTISEANGLPAHLVIIPQSGQKIEVSISKATTGRTFSSSAFTYPKAKYPNAEIVDLR